MGGSAVAAAAPRSLARGAGADRRLALFATLFGLALVPTLTIPIPAMVDYVNHLARMHELTAPHSSFYHAEWRFYPNLAMDLVVPLMARWIGVETATRLFLLAAQVLVVTGSVAIERRVQRRSGVSGFVTLLYLYNVPFAWGFLNFEFGLGVALWGIAAWLAVRDRPWPVRLAVHTAFAALLFCAHLFALGLYGATLGLHELWAWRRSRPRLERGLFATVALLGAPVAALAVLMAATGGSAGGSTNTWQGAMKLVWPFLLLDGDNAYLAIGGSILLGFLLHAASSRGELAFVQSGATLAVGFLALYLAIPGTMLDTAFADIRVLVGAVTILPAFVSVQFVDSKRAMTAATIVAGLTIANVACVEWVWSRTQPVYREMIASFGRLAPRSRVLVAEVGDVLDPPLLDLAAYPLRHAATLAVPEAGAFVPTLFATRGKQPLAVEPAWERLSNSCGGPVPLSMLRDAERGLPASPFVASWWRDYDYVYVLGDVRSEAAPARLAPLEVHPRFALYRVRSVSGSASP